MDAGLAAATATPYPTPVSAGAPIPGFLACVAAFHAVHDGARDRFGGHCVREVAAVMLHALVAPLAWALTVAGAAPLKEPAGVCGLRSGLLVVTTGSALVCVTPRTGRLVWGPCHAVFLLAADRAGRVRAAGRAARGGNVLRAIPRHPAEAAAS